MVAYLHLSRWSECRNCPSYLNVHEHACTQIFGRTYHSCMHCYVDKCPQCQHSACDSRITSQQRLMCSSFVIAHIEISVLSISFHHLSFIVSMFSVTFWTQRQEHTVKTGVWDRSSGCLSKSRTTLVGQLCEIGSSRGKVGLPSVLRMYKWNKLASPLHLLMSYC